MAVTLRQSPGVPPLPADVPAIRICRDRPRPVRHTSTRAGRWRRRRGTRTLVLGLLELSAGILTGIAAVIAAVGTLAALFALFPENLVFKIDSIVDARCRVTEDYESTTGGDKHVWQDSTAVRLRLGGRVYDLTANGAGNRIRIAFVGVVP